MSEVQMNCQVTQNCRTMQIDTTLCCILFSCVSPICNCEYLLLLFLLKSQKIDTSCVSLQVQVWDTAGQERFRKSMVEHYYRNVHAVVFVYDVTKMASFRNLQTWIEVCNEGCRKGSLSSLYTP